MNAEQALKRARRQIERGEVRVGGRDEFGRLHTRTRTLGHLDWRIEEGAGPVPSVETTREYRAQGARIVPFDSRYWIAG